MANELYWEAFFNEELNGLSIIDPKQGREVLGCLGPNQFIFICGKLILLDLEYQMASSRRRIKASFG